MRVVFGFMAVLLCAGAVQAECAAVTFDYNSFTRPPGKLDYDRYVAGQEQGNYLSVGLNGITLQISPANTEQDQELPMIWDKWRVHGIQHPDYQAFHQFHERPDIVETPFGVDLSGWRSKQLDAGRNVIEFSFLRDEQGRVMASLYMNDPVGEAEWDEVLAQLAYFTTINPACVSEVGRYEGAYDPPNARFLVFPKE